MTQAKDEVPISSSFKHRFRDIFTPKPKLSSSHFPSTHASSSSSSAALPSRIPIRKKRSFRDVAEDDPDSDSSLNPRARIRQRVDSTSSIITVRGGKSVSRKSSTDSVKTICDLKERGNLKRTPSCLSLSLNPGQAAPARAVLTRTTSHNQVQPSASSVEEKGNILPVHAKRVVSFKASPKTASSILNSALAAGDVSATSSVLQHSSSLKPSKSFRSLSASCSEDVRPAIEPSVSTPEAAPTPSPEDEMLRQVLEYVVNESEDDDADTLEIQAMLSRSESTPSDLSNHSSPSTLSVPDCVLPEIPDDDSDDEAPGLRPDLVTSFGERVFFKPRACSRSHLDRFDVKVQPVNTHVALWDMDPSHIYAWPAWLLVMDNHIDYTDTRGPPIKNIDVEFHSTDDSFAQSLPMSDYHVQYKGLHLEPDIPRDQLELTPDDGIALEDRWIRGRFSDESGSYFGTNTSCATRILIPIPVSLFKGRECRYFKMKAKVTLGSWDFPMTVAHSGTIKVSIEHLRKEVHMDGRRASLDM